MPEFARGKVERVAGPVIVARQMLGSQMYEVVRVGNQGLIGEIIRIEGDKVTVQVYEETAGIRPGETVERTGKPLSVELGPGITGQIYDGIQRPLTVLFEKTGPFIKRGVAPSPVDRAKKWHFIPSAKAGAKVTGGDVIGEVKETSLITQHILVPPNVSGRLSSVVSEGDYSVAEPIGELEGPNGGMPMFMLNTWPVRTARGFTRKLPSDTPLLTGQRIMDFFFPIVKGGTAAIPGAFGTGKCVDAETPVLLADGRLRRIRELVPGEKESRVVEENGRETVYGYENGLRVVSLSNPRFDQAEAPLGYRGYTDRMVSVKTRSGRMVKVTPIHRLRKFVPDGTVAETAAGELKPGDFLVAPRKVQLSLKPRILDPYELLPEETRVVDKIAIDSMVRQLEGLREDSSSLKALSRILNTNYHTVLGYYLRRNRPTLGFLKRLSLLTKETIRVESVKAQRQGTVIRLPSEVSTELAEFLGLVLSDGTIRGRRTVLLFNNDKVVLRRFSELGEHLFGVKAKQGVHRGGLFMGIVSTALVNFLSGLGVPLGKKSRTLRVPDTVFMSPDNIIGSFLAGYIAGDGSFSGFSLEITTASPEMSLGLSYLFTRLGVFHRTREKPVAGYAYHRLTVEGKSANGELYNALPQNVPYRFVGRMKEYLNSERRSFNAVDTVPIDPSIIRKVADMAALSRKESRNARLWLENYTELGENMGIPMLKRFVSTVKLRVTPEADKDGLLPRLDKIVELSDHVFFDEIVHVEHVDGVSEVYDVVVPGYENFVGGWGAMICHNTMMQQQLAKWADASVIVYVGCGERGNEMAEVLETFPQLKDPHTGEPLMNRTILIANTSNMPIAAREASVYTGITIAEYFRDMGYDVALMADSTSRWAEALREISGRLEEMPGEEGYPAYLASRLAEFYERAGRVEVLGSGNRVGSISVIGAVSPPGGDFSEPVTQNTLRIAKVFWALDKELASRRHFPAINWLTSYSLYLDNLGDWYHKAGPEWVELRKEAMNLLQRDEELREIVMLVGPDALSEGQRVVLEAARMIKEDFLMQHAYHTVDSYCAADKTYDMIRTILQFYKRMQRAVDEGVPLQKIVELPVKNEIARMRLHPSDDFKQYSQELVRRIEHEFDNIVVTVKR